MIVGVLGAGQLGRMLALAGYPLGLQFRFFDHDAHAPAGQVGPLVVGEFQDNAALDRFADGLSACTLEFENVPVSAVRRVAGRVPTFPPGEALATAQDRGLEKACFTALGIPTTRYELVDSRDALAAAVARIGSPCVVKSRRMGYDGKGQAVVRGTTPDELDGAWKAVSGQPSIVEEFIAFDREVSIIGARGRDGVCAFFPMARNHHEGGILRVSRAYEGEVPEAVQRAAESALRKVMDHFGYVGVLTIEFFEQAGALIANEMAPRVHNSGHWTIEGASCSQFELHLRAVCGLPMHAPRVRRASAMVNLIGTNPPLERLAAVDGARVHLYGKPARPGRKIGHVTLTGDDAAGVESGVARLLAMVAEEQKRTG